MRASSIAGLALSAAIPATVSAQLNQLAKAEKKSYFGTGADNGELYDSAYVKITSAAEKNLINSPQPTDRSGMPQRRPKALSLSQMGAWFPTSQRRTDRL